MAEFVTAAPGLLAGLMQATWEIFTEAAPYLVFGFGVAGLLNVLVPDQKIVEYLGTSAGKVKSVINASLAGLPLPLCSCGVIPAAISLRKRGASRGATLSFLISTPQTGVDSIAITYALLDPLMTVFRPIATLVTAVLAGLADNLLLGEEDRKTEDGKTEEEKSKTRPLGQIPLNVSSLPLAGQGASSTGPCSCGCGHGKKEESGENRGSRGDGCGDKAGEKTTIGRIMEGLKYAYIDLLGDISKWVLIGILIAGLISYAVPESLIQDHLSGGIGSMLLMLVVGIPLYICATASTPLAAALVAKGMSPGTAFVFLLAGPATNAATITLVARFLGKRSAVLYLAVISLCALGSGLFLDYIYLKMGISASATIGSAAQVLPESVKTLFALLLLPLMLYGIYRHEREGAKCSH